MSTPTAPTASKGSARRWLAIGAVLLTGLALGAALGSGAGNARLGELPPPTLATLLLTIAGLIAGVLALLSPLALRLLAALALYALAGLALTRWGPGPGAAFAAGPVALWAARVGRTGFPAGDVSIFGGGSLIGFTIGAPQLLSRGGSAPTIPVVALVIGLALAGVAVALVHPGTARPTPARFELRAALAMAGLTVAGFVVALGLGSVGVYFSSPAEAGGLARRTPELLPLLLLGSIIAANVSTPKFRAASAISGLGTLAVGFLLAASGVSAFLVLYFALPAGFALLAPPCLRRAERVHEALGIGTLLLATLLGFPLAATLVRGFTRLLPGAVPGIGAATTTNWPMILGFYGLLALVVLLAHLAHAYEFGLAALDPDDDRDPLPILRKGLNMKKKS